MNRFTCLMYHQIDSPAMNKYYVSVNDFEAQMNYLIKNGIKCFDIDNPNNDSENSIKTLLTFDDGHRSNLEAAKIMSRLGLKGCFYVVKDFALNDAEYLSEEEIFKISELGHTIGVHGKDHEHWTLKPDDQLEDELLETKQWIESITNKDVYTCAAPGGVLDDRVINCLKCRMSDFKKVRSVKVGVNHFDDYLIKIAPVHTCNSLNTFINKVEGKKSYYAYLQCLYYTKYIGRPLYNLMRKT